MADFLLFVDNLRSWFPVHVEIYCSKIMDWNIKVYKKGCADDYPKSPHDGKDAVMCSVQNCDMEYCFAKAHTDLKEWLSEFEGGY